MMLALKYSPPFGQWSPLITVDMMQCDSFYKVFCAEQVVAGDMVAKPWFCGQSARMSDC